MPLPAIPVLAAFFASLFGALASFFARFITKKLAVIAAGITAVIAIWIAFYSGIQFILSGIAVAFPTLPLSQYSCFVPDNALACLTAVMSAYLIRWVYDWKVRVLNWQMQV